MKSRKLVWLEAAVIVAAVWWVYAPAIHGGWLWDDNMEARNPVLRDPAGFAKIWSAPSGLDYLPLKTTVQWAQWHVWGDNAAADHVTSIVLHLLSAFLIWRLLRKLGVRLAWLGGLLFAIHPLAVESVAWNAELKNTLSLPLMLLAMIAFVAYDERKYEVRSTKYEGKPPASYFVLLTSYFLFLAAMLCKSSVVMFPVVILLYCWWKRGRIARAEVLASAPFFVISLVLGLVTLWFQQHRAIGLEAASVGLLPRLAGAGLAVAFYFFKCVIPVALLPIYPRWAVNPPSVLQFLPWLVAGAVLAWLWTKRSGWGRHVLFGVGFFLVNLVPVLGLIPMAYLRVSWVADHFAYLPLVGLIGLATAGISAGWKWHGLQPMPLIFGVCIAGLVAILAIGSRQYAGIFKSEETLWTYTVQHNPDAWLARNNLGNLLAEHGRLPEAIAQFEQVLRLEPDSSEAHVNFGHALLLAGKGTEAIAQFEQALRIDPDFAGAHYNLGVVLLQMGRNDEAMVHFRDALRIDPGYAEAHNNLGLALARAGSPADAILQYEEALRLDPNLPEACLNLGNTLFKMGRLPGAIANYERALRINPRYAAAHMNLGYALQQVGRTEEAKAEFERAAQSGSDRAAVHP